MTVADKWLTMMLLCLSGSTIYWMPFFLVLAPFNATLPDRFRNPGLSNESQHGACDSFWP